MARSPGPRGTYAKSRARREIIGSIVLELVDESGHRGLTSAMVAERADMSEATVLYHYPSKEHLLVAALEAHFVRERSPSLPFATYESTGTLADAGVARHNFVRLFIALAADATYSDHPAHDFFVQHYATTIQYFSAEVERRQALRLADPSLNPVQVAQQIAAMWDGLQTQWLISPSFNMGASLERAMKVLTREDGAPTMAIDNEYASERITG